MVSIVQPPDERRTRRAHPERVKTRVGKRTRCTASPSTPRRTRPLAAAARWDPPGRVGRKRAGAAEGSARAPRGGASLGWMESAGPATCRGSMPGFLRALQTRSRGEAVRARVQEQDLRQWGLTGQWPRSSFVRGLSSRWDSPRRAGGPRARNGPSAPRVGRPVCFVLFCFT